MTAARALGGERSGRSWRSPCRALVRSAPTSEGVKRLAAPRHQRSRSRSAPGRERGQGAHRVLLHEAGGEGACRETQPSRPSPPGGPLARARPQRSPRRRSETPPSPRRHGSRSRQREDPSAARRSPGEAGRGRLRRASPPARQAADGSRSPRKPARPRSRLAELARRAGGLVHACIGRISPIKRWIPRRRSPRDCTAWAETSQRRSARRSPGASGEAETSTTGGASGRASIPRASSTTPARGLRFITTTSMPPSRIRNGNASRSAEAPHDDASRGDERCGPVVGGGGVGPTNRLEDLGPVVPGQLRRHRAGLDQPDPDVALGDLLAQRLAEGADGVLGRVVDAAALAATTRPATEQTLTRSATRRGPDSAASSRCGSAALAQ